MRRRNPADRTDDERLLTADIRENSMVMDKGERKGDDIRNAIVTIMQFGHDTLATRLGQLRPHGL